MSFHSISWFTRCFLFILSFSLANACKETPQKPAPLVRTRPPQGYVYLNNGKFELDGKPFFPKLLNCIFVLRTHGDSIWPAVSPEYTDSVSNRNLVKPRRESLAELRATLQLVRDLGYNSLRICGIGEPQLMKANDSSALHVRCIDNDGWEKRYPLNSDAQYSRYFAALRLLTDAAAEAGLKTIFLTRTQPFNHRSHEHLRRVAEFAKPQPGIMAVDFFNEPLYFDSLKHTTKNEVAAEVTKWQRIFMEANPHNLTTIGLAHETEVAVWDPNLLDVDFICFHPYEYAPDMVNNELYWYSQYVKKPWMVGETGLSAEDVKVPYASQTAFTKRTFEQACNCGAIGYALWQLKDQPEGNFHQQFLGIMNNKAFTINSKGDTVSGTPKPVNEFIRTATYAKTGNCEPAASYNNYGADSLFTITGTVFDNRYTGLEGGIVIVWDKTWKLTKSTHTGKGGAYALKASFEPYYICFAATRMETQRNDVKDVLKFRSAGTNVFSINTVELEPVKIR
jgi:hypothetical protein